MSQVGFLLLHLVVCRFDVNWNLQDRPAYVRYGFANSMYKLNIGLRQDNPTVNGPAFQTPLNLYKVIHVRTKHVIGSLKAFEDASYYNKNVTTF